MKTAAGDRGWKAIEGFNSDDEYAEVRSLLSDHVRSGLAREEPVKKPYSGVDWDEHWFRCLATKQMWRLIAPDPPFKGLFKRI